MSTPEKPNDDEFQGHMAVEFDPHFEMVKVIFATANLVQTAVMPYQAARDFANAVLDAAVKGENETRKLKKGKRQ